MDIQLNCTTSLLGRELLFHPVTLTSFILCYSTLGIASLLGNMAVLLIVVAKREMRSTTNMFIASLAASDLLVTGVSLWTTPFYHYRRTWELGESLCKMSYILGGASLFWSPFTLAAMALERYLLVMTPFHNYITKKVCLVIIISIWILVLLVLLPAIFHLEYFYVDHCHVYCLERWPHNQWGRFGYGWAILILRTLIPFALIAFCHYRIASRLSDQQSRMQRCRSTRQQLIDLQRKQRLQKLLIAMIVIFAFSSFPLDIYNVIQDSEIVWGYDLIDKGPKAILFLICHMVAMTGTLWNPLVYAWWNENFKRELNSMMGCRVTRMITRTLTPNTSKNRKKSSKTSSRRSQKNELLGENHDNEGKSENESLLVGHSEVGRRLTMTTNLELSHGIRGPSVSSIGETIKGPSVSSIFEASEMEELVGEQFL